MSEGLVLSGRYRLIQQLGAGGMGSVWRAQDLNLDTEVAVKLIDPAIAESVEAVGRFRQEAQAAAMIRSTHVVQILDHGVDHERPYIAMELLDGDNLGQRLEQLGQLSPYQTGHILGQVGRALALAHARGIVHRDLKPENVFLVREGDDEIAKVLDFGIARRMSGLTDVSLSKTKTGAMLGTPYYMSPEQATGQPVDHLSDIWSFGVIAYECLTGKRAFDGESVGALFHAICMLPPPVPSRVAVVPDGFDAWFARATARDKLQRFASIKETAEELRMICGRPSGLLISAATLSGYRPELASASVLTTTAVSTLSADLDQTTPPSTKTFTGRLTKRPYVSASVVLALIVGTAAFAILLRPARDRRTPDRAVDAMPLAVPTGTASLAVDLPVVEPVHSGATAAAVSAEPVPQLAASEKPAIDPALVQARPVNANATQKVTLPTKASHSSTAKTDKLIVKTTRSDKKSFIKRDDNAAGI